MQSRCGPSSRSWDSASVMFWLRVVVIVCVVFFFSSRRRHTRSDRDWSSDVCSSDLDHVARPSAASFTLTRASGGFSCQRRHLLGFRRPRRPLPLSRRDELREGPAPARALPWPQSAFPVGRTARRASRRRPMSTFRRIAAVLTFPAIAYMGAACERTDTPTAPRPMASTTADPTLVVDRDGKASATDCNASDPAYLTISAAVTAASSGDIIIVCPATYTENVVLNKSLTLRGAQSGVDARGRVAASEAIVTPLVAATRTLELQTGSLGSIIDGFTFLGGSRAIESTTGPIDRLQILNNPILGFTGSGVFLNDNGINITVDKNEIDGSAKVGAGDLFHLDQDNFDGFWFTNNNVVNGRTATGFFVDGSRNVDKSTAGARAPLFSGNFIDGNQTGVNLGRLAWGDGPITGNTFSNNLFDGLQGGPKNSAISQNIFDSNGRNGLLLTGFGGTTNPARGAQGNTVTQNCFTGNGFPLGGAGIFF